MTIDHFPTPDGLADAALNNELLFFEYSPAPMRVLDPGAGSGAWGKAVRRKNSAAHITGIDLRIVPKPTEYDMWYHGDFLKSSGGENGYNLIVGNPPYSQAEEFIRHSWSMLTWENGLMVFLLRLGFLAGQDRGKGLWKELPPTHVAVLSKRPSFSDNGRSDYSEYAVYYWNKMPMSRRFTGKPTLSWLNW